MNRADTFFASPTRVRALGHLMFVASCLLLGAARAAEPLPWFDGTRPGAQATVALGLLEDAASHGLEPRDYGAAALRAALQSASTPRGLADEAARRRLDDALSAAMQRYLADLHHGRVDPRRIHHDFAPPPRAAFDAAALLREALAAQRLPDAVRAATPQLAQYEQLRAALARWRALATHPAWQQPLPALPAARGRPPKLEAGQPWLGVPQLAARLAALGDLRTAAPAASMYDDVLADAVRRFQLRHGLAGDGVIGRSTLAALQVSPLARARQIELTLERLRWTPLLQSSRMVVINVPEFVLRAYEVRDGRVEVRQTMKVIVGQAARTRTPLFDEDMRFIEFQPYWNVPYSIARNELVPRLRRDPGYWAREGFEFVDGAGGVQPALSVDALDAVLAGGLRIRQRPGPRNALGDIKFVFPNREHIYLHHTPSVSLFERERRDFSHGCIRVEQPVALAAFVLQDLPGWDERRVREAMDGGKSFTLRLAQPVPVLIAYATALARDGTMHFFDDIYGLDRVLDAALREHSRQREAILP